MSTLQCWTSLVVGGCLAALLVVSPGAAQGSVFERTINRVPAARLLDSTLIIQQPPPDPNSHEDRFHISRVERVRYGKAAFRRHAAPGGDGGVTPVPLLVADAPHSEECKYKKEAWGDCDLATKTQRRRLVLKKGNPLCEPTKEISRPCRMRKPNQSQPTSASSPQSPKTGVDGAHNHRQKTVVCRYKKGSWSECDPHTGLKTRTDTLKLSRHGLPEQIQLLRDNCEPSRVMTRKCKATKLGCKYNRSTSWSECDARTNLRTKVLKLEGGVNRSGADCEPERRLTKNCRPGHSDRAKKGNRFPTEDPEEEDEEQA